MRVCTVLLSLICLLQFRIGFAADDSLPAKEIEAAKSAFVIQYLPNSDYETVVGLGWYGYERSKMGFYINGQLTMTSTSDRDDFYDNLSVGAFGDEVVSSISDLLVINMGLTYPLTKFMGVYAGVGYATVEGFAEQYDPFHILDDDGYYLVNDSSRNESGFNANAGFVITAGKLAVELGYHSFVESAYLGVGWAF